MKSHIIIFTQYSSSALRRAQHKTAIFYRNFFFFLFLGAALQSAARGNGTEAETFLTSFCSHTYTELLEGEVENTRVVKRICEKDGREIYRRDRGREMSGKLGETLACTGWICEAWVKLT